MAIRRMFEFQYSDRILNRDLSGEPSWTPDPDLCAKFFTSENSRVGSGYLDALTSTDG